MVRLTEEFLPHTSHTPRPDVASVTKDVRAFCTELGRFRLEVWPPHEFVEVDANKLQENLSQINRRVENGHERVSYIFDAIGTIFFGWVIHLPAYHE